MPRSEAEFVHLENIRHFEKKLEMETDPAKYQQLLRLLGEEQAKLARCRAGPKGEA